MGEVREEEKKKNVHKERNGEWGTRTRTVWGTVAVGAKLCHSSAFVSLAAQKCYKKCKMKKDDMLPCAEEVQYSHDIQFRVYIHMYT